MSTFNELIIERNVEAVMRDGTVLRANVYRPAAEGRFPVLLQRTPYNKDGGSDFATLSAARGYAVVVQDTRGRWASDGVHYPMRDEFEDGYDSVEWAAAQPWASGKVGMWGGSYVGWTQWAAAATRPPSLAAIFPSVTFTDVYRDVFRPGGALSLGLVVSWMLAAGAAMAILRLDAPPEKKSALQEVLIEALDGMAHGTTFETLPLDAMPLLSDPDLTPAFRDFLEHPTDDDLWVPLNIRKRIGDIGVPAYHLGAGTISSLGEPSPTTSI